MRNPSNNTRSGRTASILLAAAVLSALTPAFAHGPAPAAHAAPAGYAANCDVDTQHLALDGEEQSVIDQTNAYRATYGLPALHPSYALTVNALWKATDMATSHYMAHDDSFRSWDQRFRDCGYQIRSGSMGENIAAGYATATTTLQMWENSPYHNVQLLGAGYTAVGIKRVMSPGDPYGWYWSMEFGSDLDQDLWSALQGQ